MFCDPKSGEIFVPAMAALASICALTSPLLLSKVFISLADWSAVAPLSMPSNLVPSAATSRPSTLPDTVMLPTTSIPPDVKDNLVTPALCNLKAPVPTSSIIESFPL